MLPTVLKALTLLSPWLAYHNKLWNPILPYQFTAEIVLLFCLVHFFIVSGSIATGGSGATAPLAEFNDVFDPAGDPQNAFIGMVTNYPNFVAEEWSRTY